MYFLARFPVAPMTYSVSNGKGKKSKYDVYKPIRIKLVCALIQYEKHHTKRSTKESILVAIRTGKANKIQ